MLFVYRFQLWVKGLSKLFGVERHILLLFGSEILGENQLRLVVDPIIYRVLYIAGGSWFLKLTVLWYIYSHKDTSIYEYLAYYIPFLFNATFPRTSCRNLPYNNQCLLRIPKRFSFEHHPNRGFKLQLKNTWHSPYILVYKDPWLTHLLVFVPSILTLRYHVWRTTL